MEFGYRRFLDWRVAKGGLGGMAAAGMVPLPLIEDLSDSVGSVMDHGGCSPGGGHGDDSCLHI